MTDNELTAMSDSALVELMEDVNQRWNTCANEGAPHLARSLSKEAARLDLEWFKRYPPVDQIIVPGRNNVQNEDYYTSDENTAVLSRY